MSTTVEVRGDALLVYTPTSELNLVKARNIPDRRWLKSLKAWSCRPTMKNMDYIREAWPDAKWDLRAQELYVAATERALKREGIRTGKADLDLSLLDHIPFRHPPFAHQKRALLLGRDMPYFAYLMDQGTGKTKVTIDDAAHNYRQNRIDAILIIAPNSVKTNWVNMEDPQNDEISKHMPPDVMVVKGCWFSQPSKAQAKLYWEFKKACIGADALKVLSVNVEALDGERVAVELMNFISSYRTMIVVDESTRIKTRSAKRTKVAQKLRKECPLARILTGTPVIQSPLDAYSQFKFLDEDVLGFGSFYAFQNHYAQMGGFQNHQVLFFKHLDELSDKISSCSFRVTKTECLDLPPKVYQRREVQLTPDQRKAYDQMRDELFVQYKDNPPIDAPIALTQLLRLQQITGGFLPRLDPATGEVIDTIPLCDPKHNPKVQEVLDILAESGSQKMIIWARFRGEIAAMASELKRNGYTFVEFHGGVSEKDRIDARTRFQNDPEVKVFLGNPAAGGIGLNLYAATIVCYLSNSFNTEERIQSEDRAHRIGTTQSVTYYDLVASGTVDTKVIRALRSNKKIADEVMRDGVIEWI
jgi:SNF2 family DNA or RNA helicase